MLELAEQKRLSAKPCRCPHMLLLSACSVSQRLVEEAANALDNPQLVGQPLMPEEGGGTEAAQNAGSAGGGIYMGT